MDFMQSDRLSYIISPSGQIVSAMPDDDEFSLQEIRDYVAGPPEVACETSDGFVMFRNREGREWGLASNRVAGIIARLAQHSGSILGRVFLAHPDHVPSHWKKTQATHQPPTYEPEITPAAVA